MSLTRVLVVDDVADIRHLVSTVLDRTEEFRVVGGASDGAEALRAAEALRPDLILLDLDMPRVGGMEALPQLRTIVPDAKVVVLTVLGREPMEQLARQAGAVGFIEKGVAARHLVNELLVVVGLLETVEQVLDERRLSLARADTSPRAARRFVDEALRRWDCEHTREIVELLVSELVTNAVTHAESDVDVAVLLRRDAVRIEVRDSSRVLPVVGDATPEAESGRGMLLVSQLAASWGVEQVADGGKVVWFEVPRVLDDVVVE